MNGNIKRISLVLIGLMAAFMLFSYTALADEVTITGEINEQYELVSSEDGSVYRIAEGEAGEKLLDEHRGDKVRVVGRLIKDVQDSNVDELPTGLIKVVSFEDISE